MTWCGSASSRPGPRWRSTVVSLGVVLACCAVLLACRATAGPEPGGSATPSQTRHVSAADIDTLLTRVRVVARRPRVPGYDRDCGPGEGCVFGPAWSDDTDAPDAHNGCDTRNDVLREQLRDVSYDPGSHGCDVVSGVLRDPYTDTTMDYRTQGAQIHVDHLFALAAAWDLGAARWTPARRARFANDTSLELLAVSGPANLAKGDSTPASWLPPAKAYHCEYAARYLAVAAAYDLAVTAADVEVIGFVQQRSCPAR